MWGEIGPLSDKEERIRETTRPFWQKTPSHLQCETVGVHVDKRLGFSRELLNENKTCLSGSSSVLCKTTLETQKQRRKTTMAVIQENPVAITKKKGDRIEINKFFW